jgi:ubiquinone/menaquinone biosynthesis C-methylase UbiE
MGDRTAWIPSLDTVARRFNQEYEGIPFDLPDEVEAMPIFRDWASGGLTSRVASPFWDIVKIKKGNRCLDIGCGVSFLIYPWREWDAFFYGQDISAIACDTLNSRAPQLNSKLFKGAVRGSAHQLKYEDNQFDLAIATGFSCYYPLDFWEEVLGEVKRVLKPGGTFVFDVVNPEAEIAENWAILEMYLGAEVFLPGLNEWTALLKPFGAKVSKTSDNELFRLYRVQFPD